jgi:hypothetical protein
VGLFDEKTRGRKSRDIVPLNNIRERSEIGIFRKTGLVLRFTTNRYKNFSTNYNEFFRCELLKGNYSYRKAHLKASKMKTANMF